MPEKPTLDGLEDRWAQVWDDARVYTFDRTKTRFFAVEEHGGPIAGR